MKNKIQSKCKLNSTIANEFFMESRNNSTPRIKNTSIYRERENQFIWSGVHMTIVYNKGTRESCKNCFLNHENSGCTSKNFFCTDVEFNLNESIYFIIQDTEQKKWGA